MADEATRIPRATPIRYAKPPGDGAKQVVKLARTDRMIANVQVIRKGGENNLHSHRHLDGFWFVLSGRVRFYGEGDVVLGEFGRHEGMLVPRHVKYWFESVGSEDLELLQLEAFDTSIPDDDTLYKDRINFTPLKVKPEFS
jgi:mannose-6-phosphate isomerase-like protein (cupin superfamily)